jgi:hypothetical protein
MQAICPHCDGKMFVPDIYVDRLVKCERCRGAFVPEHDGRRGEVTTLASPQKLAPEPAAAEFKGMDTEHDRLVLMCEHAKVRGDAQRYHYLAAFSNAQTALTKDTWQAAAFEWHNAHELLCKITKERAKPLLDEARRQFTRLASDQLIDIVEQMQHEFERETTRLPRRVQAVRQERIAATFRALATGEVLGLVQPEVLRQVQRVADEWAQRAHA